MKGDFSRHAFDPRDHYSGVLLQQGRLLLDAEWNAQVLIQQHRTETETRDVVGPSGAPGEDAGFALSAGADGALRIGSGRYYVGGRLCENDAAEAVPYAAQPDLPDPPDVAPILQGSRLKLGLAALVAHHRHLTGVEAPDILEPALGGPDTSTRLKTTWQVRVVPLDPDPSRLLEQGRRGVDLLGALAARITTDTVRFNVEMVRRDAAALLARSLDEPGVAALVIGLPLVLGHFVRSLFRRGLAAGVDAATADAMTRDALEMEAEVFRFVLSAAHEPAPGLEALLPSGDGALAARAEPAGEPEGPCLGPPGAAFQGPENQHYRLEVIRGGDTGNGDGVVAAWSRDNGSVVAAVVGPVADGDTTLTLSSIGPDDELGFAATQTVELLDDGLELNGRPGQLTTLLSVDRPTRTVTLADPVAGLGLREDRHIRLRRWDGLVTLQPGTWQPLEAGLQVRSAPGRYPAGVYWQILARTATGSIVWPVDDAGEPRAVAPQSTGRFAARLALLALLPPEQRPAGAETDERVRAAPLLRLADVRAALRLDAVEAALSTGTRVDDQPPPPPAAPVLSVAADLRTFFRPLGAAPPALHVAGLSWQNDRPLDLDRFFDEGLQVVLDGEPEALSVNGSTFVVSAELPDPAGSGQFTITATLSGTVRTIGRLLEWRFRDAAAARALLEPLVRRAGAPIRVRVTLKGHGIVATPSPVRERAEPRRLDGQALGRAVAGAGGATNVEIVLPSGGTAPASDFESWFFLGDGGGAAPVFALRRIRFLFADPVSGETIERFRQTLPGGPEQPELDRLGQRFNRIELTFNRPVGVPDDNVALLGRSVILTNRTTGQRLAARSVARSRAGDVLTLAYGGAVPEPPPDVPELPEGQYQLIVSGSSGDAAEPVVDRNGTPLDGDFDGDPGGDFDFPFRLT